MPPRVDGARLLPAGTAAAKTAALRRLINAGRKFWALADGVVRTRSPGPHSAPAARGARIDSKGVAINRSRQQRRAVEFRVRVATCDLSMIFSDLASPA